MLSNFINKDGASQLEMEDSQENEDEASPEMDERKPTDKSDMEMGDDDGHDPLEGLPDQDG